MNIVHSIERCQRQLNVVRIENHAIRKFISKIEFRNIIFEELMSNIVITFVFYYHHDEILKFVLEDASKVFEIFILINHVDCIYRFIRNDKLQNRHIDDLLSFTNVKLQKILVDIYVTKQFYEKQWEFCVSIFFDRIISRILDHQIILLFLRKSFLTANKYEQIYKLDIHSSHRSSSFVSTTHVKQTFSFNIIVTHSKSICEKEIRT